MNDGEPGGGREVLGLGSEERAERRSGDTESDNFMESLQTTGRTAAVTRQSIEEFASSQQVDKDPTSREPPTCICYPTSDAQSCTSSATTTHFQDAELYVSSMYPSTQGLEEEEEEYDVLNAIPEETLESAEGRILGNEKGRIDVDARQLVDKDGGLSRGEYHIELPVLKSSTGTIKCTSPMRAQRKQTRSMTNGVAALAMDIPLPEPLPSNPNLTLTESMGPGAHAISNPTELRQPSNRQDVDHQLSVHPAHTASLIDDASLVTARPVALPVASPHPVDEFSDGYKRTSQDIGWSKAIKIKAKMCVLVLIVAVCGAIALASGLNASLFVPDPNKAKQMRMKESILQAFGGEGYFDSEPKRKALHWILHEDPFQDLDIQLDSETDHLIQRFSLVAFYFQTNQEQPWSYCNPPEGLQSDLCYYVVSPLSPYKQKGVRWLSAAHECQWMGISCESGSKTLSTIRIRGNNVTGTVPSELSKLSNIKKLDLERNNLSGNLPVWIDQVTSLGFLGLSSNALSGRLPPPYFSSPSLTLLSLQFNLLTGPIPEQIGSFCGEHILVGQNLLTGSIPKGAFSLTNLKWLLLGGNLMSGSLSTRMGELSSLRLFSHGESDTIGGPVPSEIGKLKVLTDLTITGTSIAGTIPETLYQLTSMQGLDLSSNKLSGTISPRLSKLRLLVQFNIADNNMAGKLPNELKHLTKLEKLILGGNEKLSGSIPKEFCNHVAKGAQVVADCTPKLSTGLPAVLCPKRCCSICCDAETKICTET